MTIQESVYFTIFSVHSLLQYFASVTCIYTNKLLYMDMEIALKSFNEMQQTASMSLNSIPHVGVDDLLVMFIVFRFFPMWYPGSGVVLDCIDSCSLPSFLL